MVIKNRTQNGFTLVEMLAAISIVAIVAAILFPVFASVRRKARMTQCASNLHQIGLALHQYANDNDGNYPPDDPVLSHNPHLVWTLLTPYTHNADVFHCPDTLGDFNRGYFYNYGAMPFFYAPALTRKAPRPGSGAVVAECDAHMKREGDGWALDENGKGIGPIIVVREDGSTSQIQGSQTERWIYRQGQWMPQGNIVPQQGDWVVTRFPGEEWPPQD